MNLLFNRFFKSKRLTGRFVGKIFAFATVVVFSTAFLYSGTGNGKIKGCIIDARTGDPLIGANVIVKGSVYGSATDLDGHYYITGIPSGNYSLRVSYVGYKTKEVHGVFVTENDIVSFDVTQV